MAPAEILSGVITLANSAAAAVSAARHFNKLFCFDALERLETALAGSLTYDQGKTQPTKDCAVVKYDFYRARERARCGAAIRAVIAARRR
jgi:hypothetical protein